MNEKEVEMGYLKTIAKGAGLVLIGMIISKFISFLYLIFVARYFGVQDYGMFSLVIAVIGVVSVLAVLGLPTAVTRFVSYYESKKSKHKTKGIVIGSLKMSLLLSTAITIILILFSDLIAFYLFHDSTGKMSPLIKIMSLSIPFYSLFTISNSASVGLKKVEHKVYTEYISQNLLKLVFTFIFGIIGLGVIGIGLGWAVSIMLTGLLAAYLLNRIFPLKGKIKAPNMKTELMKFSFPLLLISFLGVIVTYADSIMIGFFKNPESVGIYNAAMPVAQILMAPSAIIVSLLLPVFSEAYVKKGIEDVKKIFITVSKWSFYMAFPFLILFITFPSFILSFIFSNAFFGNNIAMGSMTLVLLSCGYFVTFITQPIINLFYLLKKNKVLLIISAIGGLTNFLLNLALIPEYGIIGASSALLVSYLLNSVIFVAMAWRYTGTTGFSLDYSKSIIAVLVSISISMLLKGHISFIFIGIAYFGFYTVLLLLLKGFSKADKEIFNAILRRLGKRK